MKLINTAFAFYASLFLSGIAFADITTPTQVNCTVTGVTPAKAQFFGFGKSTFVGDKTKLDLGADELDGVSFESGAHIGSTIIKHPLKKQNTDGFGSFSFYEVSFESQHNHNHYIAHLLADDNAGTGTITVSLDVVEKRALGRLVLNSVELSCTR